ncbi:MAG: ABC transporter substrate-binding protein [Sandaracinaceae bacterium]
MKRALPVVAGLLLWASAALPARGAIGPRHGGTLTLPSAARVERIDPIDTSNALEAALAEAVFDGLYEIRDGAVVPVLAAGPPRTEGLVARVPLRRDVRHHGGRPLRARQVVRSLLRTRTSSSAWLLGGIAAENGRPLIRELDDHTIEITLARRGVRLEALLAASSMAIVAGGNLRRRPLGTGPYRARLDGHGGVDLRMHRHSPGGAPWVNRIEFRPPTSRDDEIRAFELEQLDGSWQGRSLYGGTPTRPITTTTSPGSVPVILVPNRARALSSDGAWGTVARAIDRRRLERLGLVARDSLSGALPAPTLPRASGRVGLRLRLPVRVSRPNEQRIAEALAGMLDERGVRLEVSPVPDDLYASVIGDGEWDLRIAFVRAPLPGVGPLAGEALAAAGQLDRARTLATTLSRREVAADVARGLGAVVLGHERVVLHHRADLSAVTFDHLGRLALADLMFARRPAALRDPQGAGQ